MFRTAIIAFAASLFVAPAAYADDRTLETREVRTSDINLHSSAGRALLDQRIRTAARSVCRVHTSLSAAERAAQSKCFREAIDGTREQVADLLGASGTAVAVAD